MILTNNVKNTLTSLPKFQKKNHSIIFGEGALACFELASFRSYLLSMSREVFCLEVDYTPFAQGLRREISHL